MEETKFELPAQSGSCLIHAVNHRQGDGKNHRPNGPVVFLDEFEHHVFQAFGLVRGWLFVHAGLSRGGWVLAV